MKTPTTPSSHPARIVRFADGDTVILLIDLGFGIKIEKPVRLLDIESWELDSPERDRALTVKSRLNTTFAGAPVQLMTSNRGLDRYGRIRGHVQLASGPLADYLVANGMAWRVTRATTPRHDDHADHPLEPITPNPPLNHADQTKKTHDVDPGSTIETPNV